MAVLTPCTPAGSRTVRTYIPASPGGTDPAFGQQPPLQLWLGSSVGTSTPSAARRRMGTVLQSGAVTERYSGTDIRAETRDILVSSLCLLCARYKNRKTACHTVHRRAVSTKILIASSRDLSRGFTQKFVA